MYRALVFATFGFLVATAGAAAEPAPAVPRGELVGRVWAGHPVGFALLAHGDRLFTAYYDQDRRMTIASRALAGGVWTYVRPEGVMLAKRKRMSNTVGWDSHNSLVLAVDRDGCLHLAGNMHVDPLVYYRTRRPMDITTFERLDRMTGEREGACTYPMFFQNAAGDLCFRYRDGSSGNGSDLYNVYDPANRAWRRLLATPLMDGEGERNAYASAPRLGPDGRFHLAWVWRETPDCATNHTLSYARSVDFQHWEDHRGRPIALPITLARGDVIDAAKVGEGLINTTYAFGFDAAKQPVVVYHRYDAAGRSQAFAARPDGDGWRVRQLSDWKFRWAFSGGGTIQTEVSLGAPQLERDGSLVVAYHTREAGNGRWRVRADDLSVIETLPPAQTPAGAGRLPPAPAGLQNKSRSVRVGKTEYVLQWATLGPNRDRPRAEAPPPSELRLYEFADSAAPAAPLEFSFAPGQSPAGFVAVTPDTVFSQERGYGFDPARPDPAATFAVPSSPNFTNQRPLGDGTGGRGLSNR
jgi:hypothetical protein